jgi:serine phosphatase RsbU (regulator of sigma subunit)
LDDVPVTGSSELSAAGVEWLGARLRHLQTLSAALAAARTEHEAIEATLDQGLAVFEADQAVIATLDDAGREFRIVGMRGYSGQVGSDWSTFPNSDEYPLSEATRRGEPVIVAGPDELIRRYPKLAGTERSDLLVCLPMGDVGGIALGYEREVELVPEELEFMTAVARQCSEAIRRTTLDAERRRRARRLGLLAEAGAAFSRSLDYRTTLAEVANLAVPGLADCCIVDVIEATGLRQHAAVHVRPETVQLVRDIEQRYAPDPADPRSAVGAVLRTGTPTLVTEVGEDFLGQITRDPEHEQAVRSLGMRSLIIVPLIARGRTLGAITLIHDVSGRRYDDQDLTTAISLADRAALAIDNARLHSAQAEVAHVLQRGLLPEREPRIDGIDIAARYLAAGEGIDAGGDFYDVWPRSDDAFGVAIGDVSGKGPRAASMTALARHTVRVAALHEPTPSRVLRVLNDEVRRHCPPDMFCTAAYADAVRGEDGSLDLTIALGGHPPGAVVRADGSLEEAGRPGMLLGVRDWPDLTDQRVRLAAGEMLVLWTDGVTERRSGTRIFGEEGLMAVLRRVSAGWTADRLSRELERAVLDFAPDPPQDDLAIVVLRPLPPGA